MREIKFRAWYKNTRHPRMYRVACLSFLPNGEVYGILHKDSLEIGNMLAGVDFDLMEYTGFKDKNGVEVYEGDIVKDLQYSGTIIGEYEVKYDEVMRLIPFHEISGYDEKIWMEEVTYEVIGNIYDHHGLIGE